nr:MAG TPA: hypothetical protein [Caudoviricetes sp.]
MLIATPVCNFLGEGSKLIFLCSDIAYVIIKANLRLRSPSVVVFY